MSWLSRVIDAGSKHRKPLADLSEDLFLNVGDTRAKQSKFWTLLVLASLIAAGGVIGNSTPAVIGAMIVAPLATPIYGVALAAVIGSRRGLRGALLFLVGGIAVNIALGVLCGLIFAERMPLDVNPQITGRTAPTLLDLAVAVFTGVAGSFALTRRDVSDILAGVAIAISLVPVLAVVGITLGAGRFDMALGAFILFLANAAAILVSGAVVFGAAGYFQEAVRRASLEAESKVRQRGRLFIAVLLVGLLVPLGYSSWSTQRAEAMLGDTEAAAQAWVQGTSWEVDSVQQRGSAYVISLVGHGETPPVADLRTAVRAKVPSHTPVLLVQEPADITKL
jgi:uncharacterized hydrophobic protein (TIGR00271 family)